MTRFKSKPRLLGEGGAVAPDSAALAEFVGAVSEAAPAAKPVAARDEVARGPEKPTCGINLRLTERELDRIRQVAAIEDRSIQKTVRRLLLPAVEAVLERRRASPRPRPES